MVQSMIGIVIPARAFRSRFDVTGKSDNIWCDTFFACCATKKIKAMIELFCYLELTLLLSN